MSLYYGDRAQHIKRLVDESTNELILLTAYCRIDALTQILKDVDTKVKLSLVVRFDKRDVISGSSDLEIYKFVQERKGILYRNHKLHSKLFLADKNNRIFGSANITGRGLGVVGELSNIESRRSS